MTYITDIKQAASALNKSNIQLITFSHNVSYDNGLSQMYYDDFISGNNGYDVQIFGNRSNDYMVIYSDDVRKNDKYFKVGKLKKMLKSDLLELCEKLEINVFDCDKKSDLIDYLLNVDNEDYYKAHYINTSFYYLECDLDISGYSQGDHIKIKLIGSDAKKLTNDYMTNLIYDTPISGVINVFINGDLVNKIYVDEFLHNVYAYYDKNDFIKYVADYIINLDYKNLLIEWLNNNMPKNLDYSS